MSTNSISAQEINVPESLSLQGGVWIRIGAVFALLAVAAGAFGAHALRQRIPQARMEAFDTAAHYHLIHSLALVMLGILMSRPRAHSRLHLSAQLMTCGIILFSGSLYALAITGIRSLGGITPLGGVCFLAAWALLAAAAGSRKPS